MERRGRIDDGALNEAVVNDAGSRHGPIRRLRRDRTLRREADMMAFTVCIALLAALSAGSDHQPHSRSDVLVIVWGTTLGLALTHWFALTLSVRLVDDPTFTYSPIEMLGAQVLMALLVAIVASSVVLVLSADFDRLGARMTAAVFLGGLVGAESRAGGTPAPRAAAYGVGALAVAITIATLKWFVGR
jgi:hypothetical protein